MSDSNTFDAATARMFNRRPGGSRHFAYEDATGAVCLWCHSKLARGGVAISASAVDWLATAQGERFIRLTNPKGDLDIVLPLDQVPPWGRCAKAISEPTYIVDPEGLARPGFRDGRGRRAVLGGTPKGPLRSSSARASFSWDRRGAYAATPQPFPQRVNAGPARAVSAKPRSVPPWRRTKFRKPGPPCGRAGGSGAAWRRRDRARHRPNDHPPVIHRLARNSIPTKAPRGPRGTP